MQFFQYNNGESNRRRLYLFLVDATDGITPELGEAGGQPQISKNGGSFINTTNVLVSISNGSYYVQLTTDEVDTLGWMLIRYKSANTAEFQCLAQVIAQEWFLPGGRML